MFTYKFIAQADRNNKLRLQLINNRVLARISMGIRATQEEIDAAISGNAREMHLNKLLAEWIAVIRKYMLELADAKEGDKDVKEIKLELQKRLIGDNCEKIPIREDKPVKGNFTEWFQKFMDSKTNSGTKGVYKHTLDRIRLFDPDIDVKNFENINLQWLTDFEAFCAKTASKNARNIHLRNIRAVFNNALDFEVTTAYPFRRFKIRAEETRKRDLPVDELRKVFDYPVEPYAEIYRDMFKLSFMLIGINCVDMHRLKEISGTGRIEYKRAKTGRLYSIKVEPEALDIIERYRGETGLLSIADRWSDHRNFRHQCDNALQLIGAVKNKGGRVKGGAPKKTDKKNKPKGLWPELTTYWARHSWASIAAELDIPDAVISLALGHAGENATTERYIHRNQKKVDRANRMVLDWVLHGKKTPWVE